MQFRDTTYCTNAVYCIKITHIMDQYKSYEFNPNPNWVVAAAFILFLMILGMITRGQITM